MKWLYMLTDYTYTVRRTIKYVMYLFLRALSRSDIGQAEMWMSGYLRDRLTKSTSPLTHPREAGAYVSWAS